MAADGSAFGIVKAHLGNGAERYLLELSGVQLNAALQPGTPIVSSGIDAARWIIAAMVTPA